MPITQSAKKALRQSERRRKQNSSRKDAYKAAVKNYKKMVAAKKTDEAKKYLSVVFKALDKAAKTNAIQKNKVSRLKSRLSKKVSSK